MASPVSQLHPLSLACAHVCDLFVDDIISEVALACAAEPLPAAHTELLEGVNPEHRPTISPALRSLIRLEAEATAKAEAEASAALASGALSLHRQKPASDMLVCTNCRQQVNANRYAPHLERCMLGKGRASARAANNFLRES